FPTRCTNSARARRGGGFDSLDFFTETKTCAGSCENGALLEVLGAPGPFPCLCPRSFWRGPECAVSGVEQDGDGGLVFSGRRRSADLQEPSYRAGSNNSIGFPSGSSTWICRPPGPISISLRK